jgi:hypothetical protein
VGISSGKESFVGLAVRFTPTGAFWVNRPTLVSLSLPENR